MEVHTPIQKVCSLLVHAYKDGHLSSYTADHLGGPADPGPF